MARPRSLWRGCKWLRLVDHRQTGLGSHNFENKPDKQNESTDGQPEYPPVDELKDAAMQGVKAQIHAMFFSYDETRGVIFYDDKDCNLKQSKTASRNSMLSTRKA